MKKPKKIKSSSSRFGAGSSTSEWEARLIGRCAFLRVVFDATNLLESLYLRVILLFLNG